VELRLRHPLGADWESEMALAKRLIPARRRPGLLIEDHHDVWP